MRRSLPLNALRVFAVAARTGSYAEAGVELGLTHGAVSRQIALLELGLASASRHAQKKTLIAREQDRADIKRHRRRWRSHQKRVDPSRLVFIDETWTKTNMTRLYGWAPRRRRLVAKIPHGHWKTATFLAALRNDRIDAPCVFDGPINGERFLA